jgi:hypothetical protein
MITSENLEKFIEQNGTAVVLQTLKSMSEEERVALRATALRTVEFFRFREMVARPSIQELQAANGIVEDANWNQTQEWYESARAIVLYCCDLQELKAAGPNGLPGPSTALQVLRERKPAWLDKWCSITLSTWPTVYWHTIVELERFCKTELKHTLDYYQALALGLPSISDMEKFINDSPALINEFYKFLASPTTIRAMAAPSAVLRPIEINNFMRHMSASLSDTSNLDEHPKRWIRCITNLVEQGTLDRKQIVNLSFQALANAAEEATKRTASYVPKESIAEFLCSLNDTLCPDKNAYLAKYASLLGASNSEVSIYATNVFLDTKTTDLPLDDIFSNLPLAFHNRDKAPAAAAISLLRKLASTSCAQSEAIGLAAIDAFNHKSKAIHKDAIKLLEKYELFRSDSTQMKLSASLDLLEGINRSSAAKLLTSSNPQQGTKTQLPSEETPGSADEDTTVFFAPKNSHFKYMELSGLTSLCDASQSTSKEDLAAAAIAPVNLVSMDVPRLHADQRINLVETVDDLVFQLSANLNRTPSALQLELILDGIARLWKLRDNNFDEKTQSLRHTLEQIDPLTQMPNSSSAMGRLAHLWLTADKGEAIELRLGNTPLASRCYSLAERLHAGLVLPMLATPTHNGGWLDPLVLVRRLKDYQEQGRLVDDNQVSGWQKLIQNTIKAFTKPKDDFSNDDAELIQALLRLAPDGRTVALEEAHSISGLAGKTLRFALGGGDITEIDKPPFAVAAFRSHTPRGTCPNLADNSWPHLPDVVYPAQYTYNSDAIIKFTNDRYKLIALRLPDFLTIKQVGHASACLQNSFERFGEGVEPKRDEIKDVMYPQHLTPTLKVHSIFRNSNLDDWSLDWLQNREPLLARMAKNILHNINSIGNDWQDDYSILFDPDFPLDENGSWLLTLALVTKHDDVRRLTLDLLIAAVEEKRVNAAKIGENIALLLEHKFTILRWTKSFRELARISQLHALFAWKVMITLLEKVGPACPMGFTELLLELKDEYGFAVPAVALEQLKQVSGSGKAATLAKKLVADGTNWSKTGPLNEAAKQSFASRVARVERWQRSQYFVEMQS